MSAFRSGLNKLIALLGLGAVLLGAFEHEDLIFQDAVFCAVDAGGAEMGVSHSRTFAAGVWHELTADSGTEGTFRSEQHRFWLSPRQAAPYARLTVVTRQAPRAAASLSQWAAGGRPRRLGIVALRL